MADPRISPIIAWGFRHYVRYYMRRNLSALRIARGSRPNVDADQAVICYMNHPSWWDPLIAMTVNDQVFSGRQFFAPMDAAALESYPVFRKLGYFGIDMQSREGARNFIETSRSLLSSSKNALWITPAGKFTDVRSAEEFEPGLAHLASNIENVLLVPMAIELVYWEERTPEALVEFGIAETSRPGRTKDEWRELLESRLAETQSSLAQKSQARDHAAFDVLIDGSAGIGGFYEWVRRVRSTVSGKSYTPRHRDVCKEETS